MKKDKNKPQKAPAEKSNGKKRRILAIILSVVIILGIGGSSFALLYQAKAAVNDHTAVGSKPAQAQEQQSATNDSESVANLNPNVKVLAGDSAAAVNTAISSVKVTTKGVTMTVTDKETDLSNLGVGDIFYLEGTEKTAFKQTYIGKIEEITEKKDETEYVISTPSVDEVFDQLRFDYSDELTNDKISSIETFDGVTVKKADSLDGEFDDSPATPVSSFSSPTVEPLGSASTSTPEVTPVEEITGEGALIIESEIDLLDAFKLNAKATESFSEKLTAKDSEKIEVYYTDTGECYHSTSCHCLKKSKHKIKLVDAVKAGYRPCYICKPAVLVDDYGDEFSCDAELTLNYRLGIEDIVCRALFDWDVTSTSGIENFTVEASGNCIAEATLNANISCELSNQPTTIELPFNVGHFQGLSEKLFPLAFIGFNGTVTTPVHSNTAINALTSAVPLTIGIMVYADASGNITFSTTANFKANYQFSYKNELIVDGKWVCKDEAPTDFNASFTLHSELAGDIDAHIGASVLFYVFNLNLAEIAVVKIGAEATGYAVLDFATGTDTQTEFEFDYDFYARAYLKLIELRLRLKIKLDLWIFGEHGADWCYSYLLKDHTICSWGKKLDTIYTPKNMSYSSVYAKDGTYSFYKDTNGYLIKERNGYKEPLYEETFFIIAGIDETFIYILKSTDTADYDLYRINKTDGTNKKIITSISNYLVFDEYYIYYTDSFNNGSVIQFDRSNLTQEPFVTFDNKVTYMQKQENHYYVVTEDDDFFASFFGGSTEWHAVDLNGKKLDNATTYVTSDYGNFIISSEMTSNGFLRSTANTIHWCSPDMSTKIKAECISGWNPCSAGIFVTHNLSAEEKPQNAENVPDYKMVLYNAGDGGTANITTVYSKFAFFTMSQAPSGKWYYFDQTEKELILYSMDEKFANKTIEKKWLLEKMPCDLENCSMSIHDGTIYFYTIDDANKVASVLYRYTVA